MKILVIHEVPYLKKPVYEYQDFPERLANLGHTVSVFDYDQTDCGKLKTEFVSKTGLAQVEITHTPFTKLPILNYLTGRVNSAKMLEEAFLKNKFDVVFLYSVFINGTNTVRLCNKYNVPVVYRVLDVYHKVRQNYLIQLPLYFGEKFIYKNADFISVTNERMLDYVNKMCLPQSPKNVSILEHGVDTSYFKPQDKHVESMKKWKINKNDRVALFLGTTYSFSGLDVLVKSAKFIASRVPNFKFIIVGGGELDSWLENYIQSEKLEKIVVLTSMQPYSEVAKLISLADLTLTPFFINDVTREIVPIKIFQYLACERALLCVPIPDVMKLLPTEKSGIIYEAIENNATFISTLIDLLNNENLLKQMAKKGLKFVENNFSMSVQIKKLEKLLSDAITSKKRY